MFSGTRIHCWKLRVPGHIFVSFLETVVDLRVKRKFDLRTSWMPIVRGAIQRFLEHIDSDETAGLSLNSFRHIKLNYLPFHMRYGGMICLKALQSDRPKWGGMHADPRWMSVCNTVNKTMLERVKTGGVSASLPVSWLFLWVEYAIIPHLKEDIQGYLLIGKSGPLSNW